MLKAFRDLLASERGAARLLRSKIIANVISLLHKVSRS